MSAAKSSRPAPRGSGSSQWKVFLAGALVLVVLVGAGAFGLSRMKAKQEPATQTPAGNPTHIEGAGPMPQWLTSAPTAVVADYTWAAAHHNELQYFPCFCGCNQSAGHVSNSDCYYARDGKGTITAYDRHAYG